MGLKDVVDRFTKRKEILKDMQDHDYAETKLTQRKLSAEERALNKILEKRRQEAIKAKLNSIYKKQDKDYWKKDVITQKNIFKENGTLLQQKHLFSGRVR